MTADDQGESEALRAELARSQAALRRSQAELEAYRRRRVVRYSDRLRDLARPPRRADGAGAPGSRSPGSPGPGAAGEGEDRSYCAWVERFDRADEALHRSMESRLAALNDPPLVSVIVPVHDPPPVLLRAALDSVLAQWYRRWELCAVDDGSTDPEVRGVLAEYAARDERIQVRRHERNRHIAAASNTALEATTGRWIAPLDHDDVLAPHALATAVLALAEHDDAGLLYSDEDHLDASGNRCDPYFKPDYDPVLLLGQNYLAHLCLLRRDTVESAGGYREGLEGSQDWDLALRVLEQLRPDQVVHVPHVLYHWRAHPGSTAATTAAKPYALEAGRRAVAEHLGRLGHPAAVHLTAPTGFTRVLWALPADPPPVSVVVAARPGSPLRRTVDSVLQRTTYPRFDVTVVVPQDLGGDAARYLDERQGSVGVVREPSSEVGAGVGGRLRAASLSVTGEVLCFLHDDVEVVGDRWLEEMVGLLLHPGIGAVGAKLLAPDGSVRHAGFRLGRSGTVRDALRGLDRLDTGYFGRAGLPGCVTALSSAAMVVRRATYEDVGGHRAAVNDVESDVGLCLRLARAGWRCAVTPFAELLHHECDPVAVELATTEWIGQDPSSNPNLDVDDRSPAWPPLGSLADAISRASAISQPPP